MKLKEVENAITVLRKYHYDDNKNMRPDITTVLIDLERERLLRLKQRTDGKDNLYVEDSHSLLFGR